MVASHTLRNWSSKSRVKWIRVTLKKKSKITTGRLMSVRMPLKQRARDKSS